MGEARETWPLQHSHVLALDPTGAPLPAGCCDPGGCDRSRGSAVAAVSESWLWAEACSKRKEDFSWRGFPRQKVTDAGAPPARWAQLLSLGLAEQDVLRFL